MVPTPLSKRFLALSLCLSGLLIGCSTIEMPKGKSTGYASARFVKAKGKPWAARESSKALNGAIQDAIGAELGNHGIALSAADAELIIAYLLIIQDDISTTNIDEYFGYQDDTQKIADKAHKVGVLKNEHIESIERGAIVIDIRDAKTSKLIYRDVAVRDIYEDIPDDVRRKRIGEAVNEALADFFR